MAGLSELQFQTLVVRAVNAHGGHAFKMANKFLTGIPDLFVQLNGVSGLWEVKKGDEQWSNSFVHLRVSPGQRYTLDKVYDAGGVCGVIYFMVGKQHVYMGIFDMHRIRLKHVRADETCFTELKRGHREETIADLIAREHERHKGIVRGPRYNPRRLQPDGQDSPVNQDHIPPRARVD